MSNANITAPLIQGDEQQVTFQDDKGHLYVGTMKPGSRTVEQFQPVKSEGDHPVADAVLDSALCTDEQVTLPESILKDLYLYETIIWSCFTFISFSVALSYPRGGTLALVGIIVCPLVVALTYGVLVVVEWTGKRHAHIHYLKLGLFGTFIVALVLFFMCVTTTSFALCIIQITASSWASAMFVLLLLARRSNYTSHTLWKGFLFFGSITWATGLLYGLSVVWPNLLVSFFVIGLVALHRHTWTMYYSDQNRYNIDEPELALVDFYTLIVAHWSLRFIKWCQRPSRQDQAPISYENVPL